MISFFVLIAFCTLLISLLSAVALLFRSKSGKIISLEHFECGFTPFHPSRMVFSIHFFLIGVLFLIFDLEVVSTLPAIFIHVSITQWVMFWVFYFMVMLVGLVLEFYWGTFLWMVYCE
uniref:NADH-ubiquinone oxidoreductase chain 3 n=1 Tax=Polyplax spinulosa TaxID=468197 RepID=V9PXB2_9NEOP|nr:NADH dehydrogenase subunit 3 [Polyplax spinulosa]